jgi:hypothetical protein
LVISPKGNIAVTIEARGSNRPKDTWYYHPDGAVTVLRIDGKHVTRVGIARHPALRWLIPGIVSSCPASRHRCAPAYNRGTW